MNRVPCCVLVATLLLCGRCFAFCALPSPPPVCEEFFDARAIFVGTAIAERLDIDKDGFRAGYYFVLQVDRNFKGADKKHIEIYMSNDSASFDELEKGRKYLLFAYQSPKGRALEINGCGNSSELDADGVEQTIAELEAVLSDRKPGTGGYIKGYISDAPPGILVVASDGKKKYETLTDARGLFRIHVPTGKYAVHAESERWHVKTDDDARNTPDAVSIEDGKCVGLQLQAFEPGLPDVYAPRSEHFCSHEYGCSQQPDFKLDVPSLPDR